MKTVSVVLLSWFAFLTMGATGTLMGDYWTSSTPAVVMTFTPTVLANTTALGGYGLPGLNSVGSTTPAFTLTALSGQVTSASGGGAANTVITATDGTNTCTFTIPCNSNVPAGSQNTGAFRVAAANGAGTGCVYANAAGITTSVTTAGCTTTQPTVGGSLEGKWQ